LRGWRGSAWGDECFASLALRPRDASAGCSTKELSSDKDLHHTTACRGFKAPEACGLCFRELHARHLVELTTNTFHEPAKIICAFGSRSHEAREVQDTRRTCAIERGEKPNDLEVSRGGT
jgi:hypothetical protein